MRFPRPLLVAPALALASFVLSKLGLLIVDESTQVALLWPASTLSFLALALSERRNWPTLIGAIAVGNSLAELGSSDGLLLSAGIVATNTLEPVLATLLYRAVARTKRPRLDNPQAVLGLLAAATLAPAAATLIATGALVATSDAPLGPTWLAWWLSDGTALVAAAPIVLLLAPRIRPAVSRPETIAIAITTIAVTLIVFWRGDAQHTPVGAYPFVVLPVLLWAGLRMCQYSVSAALTTFIAVAVGGTIAGHGPFVRGALAADHRIAIFQLFLGSAVFCTLFASATTVQLQRATRRVTSERERLRAALQHHRIVVEHLPDVVIGLYDRDLRCQLLEGGATVASPYADESSWRDRTVAELFPGIDHAVVLPRFAAALEGSHEAFDWRSDNSGRLFEMRLVPVVSDDGTVDHIVALGWDATAARAHERKLQHLADRDSLTGAYNRRHFGDTLTRHLDTCSAESRDAGALLVVDLDRFKPVNDHFGHGVGDDLLREVVARIQQAIGPDDTLARIGGDEFAVLLPSADRAGAERTRHGIETAIAAIRIPIEQRGTVVGAASVGIAMHRDHPDADAAGWAAAADHAMYESKRRGRFDHRSKVA